MEEKTRLTQIVNKADVPARTRVNDLGAVEIFSQKLGKYLPLGDCKPKGDMQVYNIGMEPGNWY